MQPFFFQTNFSLQSLNLRHFRKEGGKSLYLCYWGLNTAVLRHSTAAFRLLLQSEMGRERENCIPFSPGEGEREVIKGSGFLKLLYRRDKAG